MNQYHSDHKFGKLYFFYPTVEKDDPNKDKMVEWATNQGKKQGPAQNIPKNTGVDGS